MIEEFVKWFEDLRIEDVPSVGGKNASLGEMIRNLGDKGVSVPGGFAVTAYAYKYTIEKAGIDAQIKQILSDLDTHDVRNLAERGEKIRTIIKNTPLPEELTIEIRAYYQKMEERYYKNVDVAVRSSATAEDLPDASFAGQQETYLNVQGEEELLERVRECFASLFTNRAISYRQDKGFDHFGVSQKDLNDHAEDLAATMLASTLGLDFDPDRAWDERKQEYKMSGRIVRTQSVAQIARGDKKGGFTTVIAVAVFICE